MKNLVLNKKIIIDSHVVFSTATQYHTNVHYNAENNISSVLCQNYMKG